eukprot:1725296-Pleurochrysis_carterae.AAC.1
MKCLRRLPRWCLRSSPLHASQCLKASSEETSPFSILLRGSACSQHQLGRQEVAKCSARTLLA